MSYDIAIGIPPIHDHDAQAWQEIDGLLDEQGQAPNVFRSLYDQLTARYPCLCSLPDEEIDDGVWSDGPLWNNFGPRAAVLGIAYSRVDEVLPLIISTATSLGLPVFDWATGQIHRSGGFNGLTLTVEGYSPLESPTLIQLHAAVDSLTVDGGPGFLVLEGPGDDYAQTAGGDGVYTSEWREYTPDGFQHWVAGVHGRRSNVDVEVTTNGFQVTVKENERIAASDVRAVLAAFANQIGRPSEFSWRDVTKRFA